jgi:hypothetical protein
MARVHTAAAAVLVAGIVLVPLGMWLYVQAASVDKTAQVAHARQLLVEAAPPPGSRNLGAHVYEVRAWNGDVLVPISSYGLETAYRLRRPLVPSRLIEHYRRQLPGWRFDDRGPEGVIFSRGGDAIDLDFVEYAVPGEKTLRSYGVIVSQ